MDDFGTGYSSLSYLRRLPIDILEIDRSFVMNADSNEEDMLIVKTILALGETLKLTVVAKGIEADSQAEILSFVGFTSLKAIVFPSHFRQGKLRNG